MFKEKLLEGGGGALLEGEGGGRGVHSFQPTISLQHSSCTCGYVAKVYKLLSLVTKTMWLCFYVSFFVWGMHPLNGDWMETTSGFMYRLYIYIYICIYGSCPPKKKHFSMITDVLCNSGKSANWQHIVPCLFSKSA